MSRNVRTLVALVALLVATMVLVVFNVHSDHLRAQGQAKLDAVRVARESLRPLCRTYFAWTQDGNARVPGMELHCAFMWETED